MSGDIGRRGGGHIVLDAGPDRDGDHVALDPFLVAHPCIATGRQHIDEAVVGADLQGDAWVGRQEPAGDLWQDLHGHDRRHVESERPLGAVAEAVHRVERALDFTERRRQAFQHPLARFGWGDAAGGAVEQAHAQHCLQSPHRFAEGRGRHAAQRGRATETARAGDRDEGIEIGEAGVGHCADFHTSRADNAGLSHDFSAPR